MQVLKVPFVASGGDYTKMNGGHPKALQLELAMFLAARGGPTGAPSYFEYNHENWSKWPRWGDSETSWDEVRELYTKDYGLAIADVVESPANVFTREYEKVTISVDCNKQTSSFDWK